MSTGVLATLVESDGRDGAGHISGKLHAHLNSAVSGVGGRGRRGRREQRNTSSRGRCSSTSSRREHYVHPVVAGVVSSRGEGRRRAIGEHAVAARRCAG